MSKTAMDADTSSSSSKGANFVISNNNGSAPARSSASLVPSSLSLPRQAGARGKKDFVILYVYLFHKMLFQRKNPLL